MTDSAAYEIERFSDELLPLYRRMLDLFTDRYGLADQATRQFYPELVRYVALVDRFQARNDYEVAIALGHDQARLQPLFTHLELRVTELQQEITASG